MKFVLFIVFTLLTSGTALSKGPSVKASKEALITSDSATKKQSNTFDKKSHYRRDRLIGGSLKAILENYHYKKMVIDDKLSEKAFRQYLKKVDYMKQFFLQEDVKKLSKHRLDMDDQMSEGRLSLLFETQKLLVERVKAVDKYREEIFKKPFSFKKNEVLQIDPDKRDFSKNEKELKEYWRKILKQATLSRYLASVENQSDTKKDDKKKSKKKAKKKKKTKKLSDAELRKKAHEGANKRYKEIFARILKSDHDNHLGNFFNAISSIYDPHTNYLTPKKKEDFDIDISGSLEGIGAVLQEDPPYIKVTSIVTGGPAWRQKDLEPDDLILYVSEGEKEPVGLEGMRVEDAVRYIRGKKGTEVRLTVKKADGSQKVIPIIRDVVEIGASFAKSSILEHKSLKNKVGYIHVPKFYRDFTDPKSRNSADDVRKELEYLKKNNVDAVILDLRDNGGGALEDARRMTGLFIKKGPVVQIKNFSGKTEVLRDEDESVTYDGKLVVLMNRFSASASEIVAGALQDYGRALIVGGEYSHGKGTVQTIVDLNRNGIASMFAGPLGSLKLTVQKFYRVTGESTQFKGVKPDIILPDPNGYMETREQDLDFALTWDKVEKQNYDTWTGHSIDIPMLRKKSLTRIKKNKGIQKIVKSVDYLQKRKDDTLVSLNLEKVKARDEKNKKIAEELKIEKENKKIKVSHYERSIKDQIKVYNQEDDPAMQKLDAKEKKKRLADIQKQWSEDLEQRKEEWVEKLRKDPILEEALFIVHDFLRAPNKSKVIMVKK
jgi:carboxyl-terminal processing protease